MTMRRTRISPKAGAPAPQATTRLLALARTQEIKTALSGLLMECADIALETEIGTLKSINGGLLERLNQADVVLIDLDVNDAEELSRLRHLMTESRGQASVIATTSSIDPRGVRELVRQGIDDFVPQPLDRSGLIDAIEAAKRKREQARRLLGRGKVVTVNRAKGGMGATTLAIHLALGLLDPGTHGKRSRVCLLDLDLQFGDVSLYLDLDARSAIADIVRSPSRLDTSLLQGSMVRHKSGLDVLTAPFDPMPLDALRVETASRLIDLAQQSFDYVVIDLPLALAGWHEVVLGLTDKLYLVTQFNVPAIRQTRRMIDILKEEGLFSLPISVVLNRHVWRLSDQGRLQQCIKALDHGIDYYLPDDQRRALEAVNRGVSLFEIRKRARICRVMHSMVVDCRRELSGGEPVALRPL